MVIETETREERRKYIEVGNFIEYKQYSAKVILDMIID